MPDDYGRFDPNAACPDAPAPECGGPAFEPSLFGSFGAATMGADLLSRQAASDPSPPETGSVPDRAEHSCPWRRGSGNGRVGRTPTAQPLATSAVCQHSPQAQSQ